MRLYPLAATLLCLSLPLFASSIQIGQSAEQVIEKLGKPMGTIELREKTLLLYPQGEITLKQDLVTEVDLMSEEQFAKDQERLRLEREEWLLNQERRQIAHNEEGHSIRSDKLTSRAFAALPAKDRVDYWRNFQMRYAEVDVTEQIAAALVSYETELQELRSQQRIAELEARVAQAEKETATARFETEKLREETERSNESNQYYGLRSYTDPVINNSRYFYRPPTVTIFTSGNSDSKKHRHDKSSTYRKNGVYRYGENPSEGVAERATRILREAQKKKK